jgi:UDP-glucose 4-epimerase
MLIHKEKSSPKEKVLIIGCNGFIGKALTETLKETDFLVDPLSSKDLDLTDPQSVAPLAEKMRSCQHLVMLSCLTPDKGKGTDVLMKNLLMAKHVCDALRQQDKPPHVVYFSSDAVYSLEDSLVQEETPPSPTDLYGVMHRTRELMFLETVPDHLAILRSTLVYGAGDSHNSYGPNRLRREAFNEGTITLFGEGEDTRAHIFIDDLINLTCLILKNNSVGILNGAPDESISFQNLANVIIECFEKPVVIKNKPRSGDPTHRFFQATRCYEAFPGFVFTPLREGLSKTYQKMQEDPHA